MVAVVALPASAAEIDPKALVLRQPDVPSGFRLNSAESGVRANTGGKDGRAARSGRIIGYEARYERVGGVIESAAALFRDPGHARSALAAADRATRTSPLLPLKRVAAKVGAEGWLYWMSSGTDRIAIVLWRYDRVYAALWGSGLTRAQTLALARVQQRRIAAALR